MFKGDQQNVVMPLTGPWVGIAEGDAREWFRDHPGVPLAEYGQWVREVYEPLVLRWNQYTGGRFDAKLKEILDQVHVGILQALADEQRRRVTRRTGWVA